MLLDTLPNFCVQDEKELGRKSKSTIQNFLEDWNPSSDFLKEVEDLSNGMFKTQKAIILFDVIM